MRRADAAGARRLPAVFRAGRFATFRAGRFAAFRAAFLRAGARFAAVRRGAFRFADLLRDLVFARLAMMFSPVIRSVGRGSPNLVTGR
jgi:hypothetical protein